MVNAKGKNGAKPSPKKAKTAGSSTKRGANGTLLDAFLKQGQQTPKAPPTRRPFFTAGQNITASSKLVAPGLIEILSSDDRPLEEEVDAFDAGLPSPSSVRAAEAPEKESRGLAGHEEDDLEDIGMGEGPFAAEDEEAENMDDGNALEDLLDGDSQAFEDSFDPPDEFDEAFDNAVLPEPPEDEDALPDDFFEQEIDEEAYFRVGLGSDDLDPPFEDFDTPPEAPPLHMAGPSVAILVESSQPSQPSEATCPVCSASLASMKPLVAESHVNRCLDRDSAPPSQKRRRSDKNGHISIPSSPEEPVPGVPPPAPEKKQVPVQQKSLMNFFGFSGTGEEAPAPEPPVETARWAPWRARGNNKPPPFYKKVPGTGFYVDAFGFGDVEGATGYFLTHYHADHFGGLTKKGKLAPIYCTRVTSNLCQKQLKVPDDKIVELPFEGEMLVPDGNKTVRVQTIDANHCPGSVLMLFHVTFPGPTTRSYLHCGDFRALPSMLGHPFLQLPHPLDVLFLDTTYAKPDHRFPAQERVIQTVCELVRRGVFEGAGVKDVVRDEVGRIRREGITGAGSAKGDGKKGVIGGLLGWFTGVTHVPKPKKQAPEPAPLPKTTLNSYFTPSARPGAPRQPTTLVVCGSYQIGKERLYKALASTLGTKIFADTSKRGLLECQEDGVLSGLLTDDMASAAVHVVGMGNIKVDSLLNLLAKVRSKGGRFERVLGIRPTGWTWTAKGRGMPPSAQGNSPNRNFSIQHLKPYTPHERVTILDVPYSEHSSFPELEMLVMGLSAGIGVRKCVPTVGGGREGWREAAGWCDRWVQRGKESKVKKLDFGGRSGSKEEDVEVDLND